MSNACVQTAEGRLKVRRESECANTSMGQQAHFIEFLRVHGYGRADETAFLDGADWRT